MQLESIDIIEILENGEMYIVLSSGGKPSYQYIYREAAEVYWDENKKGFKAPSPRKLSHADWFKHIVTVANNGLGISLEITDNTKWVNVSNETRQKICAYKATSAGYNGVETVEKP